MSFELNPPIDTLGSAAQELAGMLLQLNEYLADGSDTLYGATSTFTYENASDEMPQDGYMIYNLRLPCDRTFGAENQLELRIPDDF